MKTCLVPKYLQKKKEESKVVLLFSLSLPKDTLLMIKQFVYYDDPLRMRTKKTFKTYVIRQLANFVPSSDYETPEDIWEDDDEENSTYLNVYWCWDITSTVCLRCGNYLCNWDTCYGHHSYRVHCQCEQQRMRIHNHFV